MLTKGFTGCAKCPIIIVTVELYPCTSEAAMPRKPSQKEDTSWLLDDTRSSYSPDRFYIRTSDSRGHSAMITFRVLPEALSALQQIQQSREFPYRTYQDIIRDAIIHRIAAIQEMSRHPDRIKSSLVELLNIDDILSREEEMLKVEEHLARLENITSKLSAMDEGREEARSTVLGIIERVESMPEGYLKAMYLRLVKEKFGWLL